MNNKPIAISQPNSSSGSLLLGTGLAFASLILVPALATSIGLGPSVTGALRIALMKASTRAVSGPSHNQQTAKLPPPDTDPPRLSCSPEIFRGAESCLVFLALHRTPAPPNGFVS